MSLLLAFLYLLAGVLCINRPALIVKWIAAILKSAGNLHEPAWLHGRAVLFFIRLLGFLALINATMYFYLAKYSQPVLTP